MSTRRQFIQTSATLVAGSAALGACSADDGQASYADAVRTTWRHSTGEIAGPRALQRDLVRYATLAASSHNTQCWKFRLDDRLISILPDLSRRLPAVDPDDHHLFASLGCAAENLIHAAHAHGLMGEVRFDPAGEVVEVSLERTKPVTSPLFQAIPSRQSSRSTYDGRQLSSGDLKLLQEVAIGNGVNMLMLTGKGDIEKVLEYVVQGNTLQIENRAFVEELKGWIRFSDDEALRTRDGLFTRSTGNPVIPRWIGSPLFNLFFTPRKENDKYMKQVRSSAGIAVFVSDANDKARWVEAGRCYERFALQATALGVRTAFLNQPVEVSELRPQFGSYLGIGSRRPDLVVRFGYGPEMPRSLRRPVDTVMV